VVVFLLEVVLRRRIRRVVVFLLFVVVFFLRFEVVRVRVEDFWGVKLAANDFVVARTLFFVGATAREVVMICRSAAVVVATRTIIDVNVVLVRTVVLDVLVEELFVRDVLVVRVVVVGHTVLNGSPFVM
jgi:hypothetical protein